MRRTRMVLIIIVLMVGLSIASLVFTNQVQPTRKQGVVVIDMTSRNWRFDPIVVQGYEGVEAYSKLSSDVFADTVIRVRRGDTVIINIRNVESNQPHGFGLPEFGVQHVTTPPQQTVEVKFVASQAGSFTFFCTVFCGTGHPLHKGTLLVTER